MSDKKVNLIISLKDGVSSGLGRIKSGLSGIGAGMKNVMVAGVAMAGAVAVALGKMTKEFIAGQEANNALASALNNVGLNGKKLLPIFQDYATSIQRVTKYGDDVIIQAMAYGQNLGIQTGQLKEATTAAAGLAAKYKIDLQTAMMLVGRASQGQTQMLTRYGIVLDETLTPQEKFNEVLRIGADAFGLAQAETNTLSGAWSQLKNALGDAQETIIEALLSGDGLTDSIKNMTTTVLDLIENGDIQFWASEARKSFDALGNVLAPVGKGIAWIFDKVTSATRAVGGYIGGVAGGLSGGESITEAMKTGVSFARSANDDYIARKDAAKKAIQEEKKEKLAVAEEVAEKEKALSLKNVEAVSEAQKKEIEKQKEYEKAVARNKASMGGFAEMASKLYGTMSKRDIERQIETAAKSEKLGREAGIVGLGKTAQQIGGGRDAERRIQDIIDAEKMGQASGIAGLGQYAQEAIVGGMGGQDLKEYLSTVLEAQKAGIDILGGDLNPAEETNKLLEEQNNILKERLGGVA